MLAANTLRDSPLTNTSDSEHMLGQMDSAPQPALFAILSAVRGYHVYHDIWYTLIEEKLLCQREADNYADPFAVAVVKSGNVVGHAPRKISTLCSLFL